jgi:hypothetical protein
VDEDEAFRFPGKCFQGRTYLYQSREYVDKNIWVIRFEDSFDLRECRSMAIIRVRNVPKPRYSLHLLGTWVRIHSAWCCSVSGFLLGHPVVSLKVAHAIA